MSGAVVLAAWERTCIPNAEYSESRAELLSLIDAALDRVSRERTRLALERAAATVCGYCATVGDHDHNRIGAAVSREGQRFHHRMTIKDQDGEGNDGETWQVCTASQVRALLSDGESVASEEKEG